MWKVWEPATYWMGNDEFSPETDHMDVLDYNTWKEEEGEYSILPPA